MTDRNVATANTNNQSSQGDPASDREFVKRVADRVYQLLLKDLRLENERRGGGNKR